MDKVKAWVLRNFHVYAAPEQAGGKERRIDYKPGPDPIECTPEQLEAGKKAGLLTDTPPETNAVREDATEEDPV